MKKKTEFWITCIFCLVPIFISVCLYHRLPDQVATHFDASGVPNGYSPRWAAVFLVPGALLAGHLLLWFLIENDPKKRGIAGPMLHICRWCLPVLSWFTQGAVLLYALSGRLFIGKYGMALAGILFLAIGLAFPKCRQNYTAGIKLPWTLNSEENWDKTHRFAGILWIAGGICTIVFTFLGKPEFFIWVIAVMALLPCVYSYQLYRKGK